MPDEGARTYVEESTYADVCARHLADGTDVEPDMARQFVQLLRHFYCGHPLILERLASGRRIPREIQYSARMMSAFPGSSVTLRILTSTVVPDSALPLDGYRRVVRGREGLPSDAILERVTLGASPDPNEVQARRQQEAKESVDAGRMLESVLAFFELRLEADVTMPGLGEAVRDIPDEDADRRASRVLLTARARAGAALPRRERPAEPSGAPLLFSCHTH
ncbi:hypothetical protein JY651_11455 [Pyxidicoccus parkwayensis]|uniref:Uncharacterized protein n=1 Tax=Pyxidicoccus parkwayensis TaxID=2813578 RepID=A0ABX7P4Y1_9BACT|nr:hypothetical protein [Pyxidicoccus parkwaysis]QSQ25502.1 hypothetical protein JY651_11455 [Pyxidicoccus parkwaysis]